MAHSSRFACVVLISGLAACGGKSFDADPDPTSGGGNQAGGGQGGSGHAGTGRGGSGWAGSGYAGSISKGGTSYGGTGQGGRAGECAGFDDEPGSPVQVAILNKTTAPIYLGQDTVTCGVAPLFDVVDASGIPLPPVQGCTTTCQQLRDSGLVGCPAICPYPSTVALQPGETLYTSWAGMFLLERELSMQCASPDYGTTCWQPKQAQPGTFTFSAVAGRSIDCLGSTAGACEVCTLGNNGAGGCTTPGSLIAGQMLNATTTLLLDYRYGVWGSPQPGPVPALPGGGADYPVQMLLSVELVFTD